MVFGDHDGLHGFLPPHRGSLQVNLAPGLRDLICDMCSLQFMLRVGDSGLTARLGLSASFQYPPPHRGSVVLKCISISEPQLLPLHNLSSHGIAVSI